MLVSLFILMFLLLFYQLLFQVFNLHIDLVDSITFKLMKILPILWILCNFPTVSSRSINEKYKIAGRYQSRKNFQSDSMYFRIKNNG